MCMYVVFRCTFILLYATHMYISIMYYAKVEQLVMKALSLGLVKGKFQDVHLVWSNCVNISPWHWLKSYRFY